MYARRPTDEPTNQASIQSACQPRFRPAQITAEFELHVEFYQQWQEYVTALIQCVGQEASLRSRDPPSLDFTQKILARRRTQEWRAGGRAKTGERGDSGSSNKRMTKEMPRIRQRFRSGYGGGHKELGRNKDLLVPFPARLAGSRRSFIPLAELTSLLWLQLCFLETFSPTLLLQSVQEQALRPTGLGFRSLAWGEGHGVVVRWFVRSGEGVYFFNGKAYFFTQNDVHIPFFCSFVCLLVCHRRISRSARLWLCCKNSMAHSK